MNSDPAQVRHYLEQARLALRQGDRRLARTLAQQAAALDPLNEEPWLWLAAVASPRASLVYLARALEINPYSRRARRAMDWAVKRARQTPPPTQRITSIRRRPLVEAVIPSDRWIARRSLISPVSLAWAALCLLLGAVLLIGVGIPTLDQAALAGVDPIRVAQVLFENPTLTPSITPTATETPTPTATFTPTFTSTPTDTATPTETPSPTATFTPEPTETPLPGPDNPPPPVLPEGVSETDHWIDVNLTWQRAYAYTGTTLMHSFVVSTGTSAHPTVTGRFEIYLRYRYADMAGPGYYLPDVPYVMYFYEGYGLHGTYWHDNFGTPMSHGCVNFRTDDAGWVFDFTDFGTVVNVHY